MIGRCQGMVCEELPALRLVCPPALFHWRMSRLQNPQPQLNGSDICLCLHILVAGNRRCARVADAMQGNE